MSIASQIVITTSDPSETFKLIEKDELYSLLAELRSIKRLVGGLEIDEDGLEQVWRIADKVQTKILELVESS